MTRTIEITEEMIRGGSRNSDTNCPIGLALQAAGLTPISVGLNYISCALENRIQTVAMPREAAKFLRAHDAAKAVRPTRFRLTFLDEVPRSLPARFRRKPLPKAPSLPARPARFRGAVTSLLSLFTF